MFVLIFNRLFECGFFLGTPCAAFAFDTITTHGCQHTRRLLAPHHRDTGIWPHPHEAWRVSAAAHTVITGAKTTTDNHRELRHIGGGDCGHHLGAIARNTFVFVFASDHEAGDVLQEHQWNLALAAQLNKVRALQCRFGEQNTVVGNNADWHAVDMGKATHQGRAITRFEFIKMTAINHARNHFTHVERFACIDGNHSVQFTGWILRFFHRFHHHVMWFLTIQVRYDLTRHCQSMGIVLRQMIDHAGQTRVDVTAPQIFRTHYFTRSGFHQWRATQENRALVLHDDRFITHRWHIGTTSCTRTHHHSDLWDAFSRHIGLVIENTAKVIAIREHIILVWQVRTATVNQVNTRQVILLGDFLRAQMLFHCHRIIGAALHRRIITNNNALLTRYATNAGNHTRARRRIHIVLFLIHIERCELREFEERCTWIEQILYTITWQELAAT